MATRPPIRIAMADVRHDRKLHDGETCRAPLRRTRRGGGCRAIRRAAPWQKRTGRSPLSKCALIRRACEARIHCEHDRANAYSPRFDLLLTARARDVMQARCAQRVWYSNVGRTKSGMMIFARASEHRAGRSVEPRESIDVQSSLPRHWLGKLLRVSVEELLEPYGGIGEFPSAARSCLAV